MTRSSGVSWLGRSRATAMVSLCTSRPRRVALSMAGPPPCVAPPAAHPRVIHDLHGRTGRLIVTRPRITGACLLFGGRELLSTRSIEEVAGCRRRRNTCEGRPQRPVVAPYSAWPFSAPILCGDEAL